jgi:hypothetical protein
MIHILYIPNVLKLLLYYYYLNKVYAVCITYCTVHILSDAIIDVNGEDVCSIDQSDSSRCAACLFLLLFILLILRTYSFDAIMMLIAAGGRYVFCIVALSF